MTNAPWSLLSLYFLPFLLKKKDEKWLNIYQKAPNRIDSIENYSPLVFFFFWSTLRLSLLFSFLVTNHDSVLKGRRRSVTFIQKNTDNSSFLLSRHMTCLYVRVQLLKGVCRENCCSAQTLTTLSPPLTTTSSRNQRRLKNKQ